MFGWFIGMACLIGLVAVVKGGRHRCGRGWHGRGWHGRGWHGGHGHRGRHNDGRGWLRPQRILGYLFDRLDTTPSQEREISGAVGELFDRASELKREGRATRNDIASLLRTESLDETVLGELFARHDERLREVQKAFADALGRVHQALDPDQRARLASLIESDHARHFGGPYRGEA